VIWTNVLTTYEFWAGASSGALISAVISSIITARSVRASDRRKAAQDDAMQTREDKLRDEESPYSAAPGVRSGGHRNPDRNHRCQRGRQHPA